MNNVYIKQISATIFPKLVHICNKYGLEFMKISYLTLVILNKGFRAIYIVVAANLDSRNESKLNNNKIVNIEEV